jgi:hypothetical protein
MEDATGSIDGRRKWSRYWRRLEAVLAERQPPHRSERWRWVVGELHDRCLGPKWKEILQSGNKKQQLFILLYFTQAVFCFHTRNNPANDHCTQKKPTKPNETKQMAAEARIVIQGDHLDRCHLAGDVIIRRMVRFSIGEW